jgi:endonuclease YncB( thermonuclease family)
MIYSKLRLVAHGFLASVGLLAGCVPVLGSERVASGPLKPKPVVEAGRLVRVVDGDTYDVLSGGVVVRLRLLGVDAPEKDQPFGVQAADSVARLLPVGGPVLLTRTGVDLYGRTLGALRLPVAGHSLALDSLLVVRGWAWAAAADRKTPVRALQQTAAQQAQRGLWKCGQASAVPPKLWRSFNAKTKRLYRGTCRW